MTNPEAAASVRFALLTNGSDFSRAVIEQLHRRNFLPGLLVVPEYPPASTDSEIFHTDKANTFLSLLPGIETIYAPRLWQAQCAEQIRQRDIDYILVACWPYLIETELRTSVRQASLNLHPSRLPRYRGANPLQQQIAANDPNAGVTLHLLDGQFDHGKIIAQHGFMPDEVQLDLSYLEARCAETGVEMFISAVVSGAETWQPRAQADQALETD